ncbi:MerR family transcriptional regulator [Streptacidiphilus sp. NEAU-YB345]|uniref:MerR family transcriptional regulator n=1 Tax=Streptacidiphilus fuscans TaxID=2789292 RepID=A0A931B2M7_9ACTN|nr:MerR family transcriptional regulator [Streptacidiphilus fuscans]
MPGDEQAGLPTGEVARRLGVSPVTLRSWERRYGIGPAHREQGRHRRWSAADIALLEAMCELTSQGLPPAEAARVAADRRACQDPSPARGEPPTGGGAKPSDLAGDETRLLVRGLVRAADRLDAPTLQESLADAVDLWGVEDAWEAVIAPTLRAAGRRWATVGEPYVEVEHFLSWHIAAELRRRAYPVARQGPVALLAAVPAEDHTLPLDALAAALTGRGIAFRMLGASVPPPALVHAMRRLGPAAVVLWSQTSATAMPGLAAAVPNRMFGVAGARRRPLLLLAGPGWRGVKVPDCAVLPQSLRAAVDCIGARAGLGVPSNGAVTTKA